MPYTRPFQATEVVTVENTWPHKIAKSANIQSSKHEIQQVLSIKQHIVRSQGAELTQQGLFEKQIHRYIK